jgi:hypothetical protein
MVTLVRAQCSVRRTLCGLSRRAGMRRVTIVSGVTLIVSVAVVPRVDGASTDAGSPIEAGREGSAVSAHCDRIALRLALPPDHGHCADDKCVAAGGICAYAGFCFGQACVMKSRDSGRTCTDTTQCESACLARPGAVPGPGTGVCSPTLLTFGCHVYVTAGVISRGAMCAD